MEANSRGPYHWNASKGPYTPRAWKSWNFCVCNGATCLQNGTANEMMFATKWWLQIRILPPPKLCIVTVGIRLKPSGMTDVIVCPQRHGWDPKMFGRYAPLPRIIERFYDTTPYQPIEDLAANARAHHHPSR